MNNTYTEKLQKQIENLQEKLKAAQLLLDNVSCQDYFVELKYYNNSTGLDGPAYYEDKALHQVADRIKDNLVLVNKEESMEGIFGETTLRFHFKIVTKKGACNFL